VVRTRADLFDARRRLAAPDSSDVAAVLTMGALHDGHVALLRAARARVGRDGVVIVTVFVNPLQFGPAEDLSRYPRTMDADLDVCDREGVDLVFAPDADEMYPDGAPTVTVDPGLLGDVLEGSVRPGHFAGVLTVVCKLLNLVGPSVTFFGEKDYQQLALVRRMVADLELGVEVVAVPTVREPDGLALSSRNRYLDPAERVSAAALSAALRAGQEAARRGMQAALTAAREVFDADPGVVLDYLEVRGPDLGEAPQEGPARMLVAARVGTTRLIDNVAVTLHAPATVMR
jgi:pantoate--beta-alanine ligase